MNPGNAKAHNRNTKTLRHDAPYAPMRISTKLPQQKELPTPRTRYHENIGCQSPPPSPLAKIGSSS